MGNFGDPWSHAHSRTVQDDHLGGRSHRCRIRVRADQRSISLQFIQMKKLIAPIVAVALFLNGCATYQFTDLEITGAATLGARAALLAVPGNDQTSVKNWMMYIATRLRTLTGNPTAAELTDMLVSSIPPQYLTSLPELKTIVIPAVVDVYETLYQKYGASLGAIKILNDIATGVEAAAA
jgi:hypothetical protein